MNDKTRKELRMINSSILSIQNKLKVVCEREKISVVNIKKHCEDKKSLKKEIGRYLYLCAAKSALSEADIYTSKSYTIKRSAIIPKW